MNTPAPVAAAAARATRFRRRYAPGAALPHVRLGRRRQVHLDRPLALRAEPHLRRPSGRARPQFEEARHHRSGYRLCLAARRPGSRARAGHHHRRGLSLFRLAAARLRRRRHAGPRAIYPQHGDRRIQRRPRRAAGGCAQGPVEPDAPPRDHREPAGHPLCRSGGEQDRSRRVRSRGVRADFRAFQRLCRRARLQGDHGDSDFGALRRQCVVAQQAHALVCGAASARISGNGRCRGRPRRQAVPHAGAMGQSSQFRFPRLCRHDRQRQRQSGRRHRGSAIRADHQDQDDCRRRRRSRCRAGRRFGHRHARRRNRYFARRHARRAARPPAGRRPVRGPSGLDVERATVSRAAPTS